MITLSIVAAGIIALAAALLARSAPEQRAAERAADQRGITLQTLIVTAVLVAMAFVAGGVILAITNAQSENLEDSSRSDTGQSNCEPWEIYDLTRAAAGRGGGLGGIGSSGKGCVRVCYIRHTSVNQDIDSHATMDTMKDIITNGSTDGLMNLELVMSRSNIASATNVAVSGAQTVLVVSDTDELAVSNTDEDPATAIDLDQLRIDPAGDATARNYNSEQMTIRVASSQNYCEIVDAQGDELLRSVDA